MQIQPINPTDPSATPIDLTVRGRAANPFVLLFRFLFTLLIVACIVGTAIPGFDSSQGLDGSMIGLIALMGFLVYSAVLGLWKQWRYPPLLKIRNNRMTVQLTGMAVETALNNVADVFLSSGQLCLRFHELHDVNPAIPPTIHKKLANTFQLSGCHFVTPRGVFNLAQSNELRQALRLPVQVYDSRGENLSDFESGLIRATPRTWVTVTVLAINILVFSALLIAGATKSGSISHVFSNVDPELILDFGGNFPPLTANGQPWRLLSCIFLHWTLIHLMFNMWILNDMGRLVERIFGSVPYLFVYLFSGICGSLATVYWSAYSRPIISAGASGAVFGLFGLMLGMLRRRGSGFPAELLQAHRASCLSFIVFNLLFGMTMPNVDMAAHVGGLVGGFLCGLIARPILPPNPIPPLSARLRFLIPLCVILTAVGVALLPHPGVAFSWELSKFLTAEQKLGERYNEIISNPDAEQNSAATAELIERDIVTGWKKEEERMAALSNVSSVDHAAWQVFVNYIALRKDGFHLLSQAIAEHSDAKQRQAVEKLDAARTILQDWVKLDGKRFGLTLLHDAPGKSTK